MAEAARRARESAGAPAPTPPGPTPPTSPGPPAATPGAGRPESAAPPPPEVPPTPPPREPAWIDQALAQREPELSWDDVALAASGPAHQAPPDPSPAVASRLASESTLRAAVVLVAAVVVAAGIALGVAQATRHNGPITSASHTPSSTHPPIAHAIHRPQGHTTPTTGAAVTSGGAPVLSHLSPASGSPGTQIQVSGSNFLSADGLIVGHFGGQIAPTSCPSESTCTLTVPDLPGGPRAADVTITTESGTSNALTFRYV